MSQPGKSEVTVSLDGINGQPTPGQQPPQNSQDTQQPAPGAQGGTDGERLFGGKYKTVEELEAAYAELSTPADDKGGKGGPATIDDATADDARDALARAGLNLDDFATEFNSNGSLSEESYKKLQDAGYPKELVDVYVDGLRARVQTYENAVYSPAGGKAGYDGLVQWAKTNLSAEQKRAFNEAVQSGDAGRAALAVQGLVALRGGNGRLLNGKTTSNADAGPKPFQSQAQVVEAMRDVRYHRDPAYRAEVSARLAVSPLFK
ncbi:hypothetical protein JY432_03025 [Stenotrophomonas maltophilia]|nr:hypothetical protein [Stenotrophomonas maltophilia]